MPTTLWQLFDDENGNPLLGRGVNLWDASVYALPHGAAHVWLWRPVHSDIEILVQQRSADKLNWPSNLNKSAGGHILVGEDPAAAAIRKLEQELGLQVGINDLQSIGRYHWQATIGDTELSENEYQWLYLLKYEKDDIRLAASDVECVTWMPLDTFVHESMNMDAYVPYGREYYRIVYTALRRLRTSTRTKAKAAN